MMTFEQLWRKAPYELTGLSRKQLANARSIAKYIYNQVIKNAEKQKAAKKI